MHGAPSVSHRVTRYQGVPVIAVALSGLSVFALWQWQRVAPVPPMWLVAFVLLCVGGLAWALVAWWRSPQGVLQWDGQNWSFEPHAPGPGLVVAPHQMAVALDLQCVVLLKLPRKPHWLWLQRGDDPAHWGEVRRALHLHSGPHAANP